MPRGPLFQAWNSSATCSFKWSPDAFHRAPKSLQICANTPGELSREDLETQSGKSCLPEPPRVSLICLPYSKYHGFLTSQGVPPGFLWAPFWLHFGSLLGTFGFQKSPKVRKIYFPKNIKNWQRKKCSQVLKWTPKGGQIQSKSRRFLALFFFLGI